jgi:hypothetical protein
LKTSGAELKQKILDLSAKRMALLAELKEIEAALTHANKKKASYLMLSRFSSKKEISKLAKPWQ